MQTQQQSISLLAKRQTSNPLTVEFKYPGDKNKALNLILKDKVIEAAPGYPAQAAITVEQDSQAGVLDKLVKQVSTALTNATKKLSIEITNEEMRLLLSSVQDKQPTAVTQDQ